MKHCSLAHKTAFETISYLKLLQVLGNLLSSTMASLTAHQGALNEALQTCSVFPDFFQVLGNTLSSTIASLTALQGALEGALLD